MVRTMTRRALVSFLGVLAAGAASLAASEPPPDWTLEDSAEGEITLAPEAEETVRMTMDATDLVAVGSILGRYVHGTRDVTMR